MAAFFSYSRDDSGFALRLAQDLKAAGANVWIDQLDIPPGMQWDRMVEGALNSCPVMMVILSPVSVKSENVLDEVSFALSKQKRVIPVLYRECDVPFRLARLQHIDFRTDYARGLNLLLEALSADQPLQPIVPSAPEVEKEREPDSSSAAEPRRADGQEQWKQDREQAAEQAGLKQDYKAADERARRAERARQHATSVKAPGTLPQPLSAKDYALIAAVMMGIGIGLLVLFVLFAPRLVPANTLNQFFYIVLIVWGLVCALVLFGVMKSYAHLTYKSVGSVVELGGPAAFAALVVVGGFWLVPRTDTFHVTIRPHGPSAPRITSGKISMELGSISPNSDINSNGEADFKDISRKFWGAKVKVLPQVHGYKEGYQTVVLDKDAIDLNLVPAETVLKGKIVPAPRKGQMVKVLVQGEDGEKTPDGYGRFEFLVHKDLGEQVRVDVCTDGQRVYDDYVALMKDEVNIPTRKPDVPCSN
jgi:hypothetical protein